MCYANFCTIIKTIHCSRKGEGAKGEDASVKAITVASIIRILLMVWSLGINQLTCVDDHCKSSPQLYEDNSY